MTKGTGSEKVDLGKVNLLGVIAEIQAETGRGIATEGESEIATEIVEGGEEGRGRGRGRERGNRGSQ